MLIRRLAEALASVGAQRLLVLAAYATLTASVLSPLLWVNVPPLVDYPNHLARMWILVHRAKIPALAHSYVIDWRILPDLAMDLVVPALASVMPVVVAGRVFVALGILGLIAGTVTLYRVLHGRFAIWPIWSVLFVYNAMLFWGFVACLFAVAVYFFVFAGWIASRNWQSILRIPVFSAAAALLFLFHLFAFGLYGLSVASYELGRRIESRRLSLPSLASYSALCLQFVPGLVLWYVSLSNIETAYTQYGEVSETIYGFLSPTDFGFYPSPFGIVLWALLIFTASLLFVSGQLKVVREMRLPIVAMTLVAIAMPYFVNGSALANIRLPAILPFILLASSRLDIRKKSLGRGIGVAMLIVFGLRIWSVTQSWHTYGRWFGEFRQASSAIPPGARLLVKGAISTNMRKVRLPGVPSFFASLQPPVFWHMGALAVIDRSVQLPSLFTGSFPVAEVPGREPTRHRPRPSGYVLWIGFGGMPQLQRQHLEPVAGGSFFEIYRQIGD